MNISTKITPENIKLVLEHLENSPKKLTLLCKPYSEKQLKESIEANKRSVFEELVHLLNCEARISEAVYLALLIDKPSITPIHPERQWAKLFSYESLSFSKLLAYFKVRRALLLSGLEPLEDLSWSRVIVEKNKKRNESVYWKLRSLLMHELHHLDIIEKRLSTSLD